jgi:(p)ppGpp synthase/HD superfamily hydrolase
MSTPAGAHGPFSPGVERAILVALEAHSGQWRKGEGSVPYVVHPIHVALILSRLGAGEEVLQAALLHDVVEDCPGWTVLRVSEEFGEPVARVVAELTEDKSKTWQERKQGAIEAVPRLSSQALLIKAVDKLHNLETLLASLRDGPDPAQVWARFSGGRQRTLSMARQLVHALQARVPAPLAEALERVLRDLEATNGAG